MVDTAQGSRSSDESYYVDGLSIATDVVDTEEEKGDIFCTVYVNGKHLKHIFEWNGQHYFVLVDSYSGWFEIDLLRDMTSTTVITKLKQHFSVHGCPHLLLSDNGAQYTSQQFKDFASTWDFVHSTSSPEFQQSNGLAEKAVSSERSC